MVRKLKYHEKKLLKKVDFISWDIDNNIHELKIMKKYMIQKREDYTKLDNLPYFIIAHYLIYILIVTYLFLMKKYILKTNNTGIKMFTLNN